MAACKGRDELASAGRISSTPMGFSRPLSSSESIEVLFNNYNGG